jgi:FKBP-type peptidyl-prolyl cis-trans isomerase
MFGLALVAAVGLVGCSSAPKATTDQAPPAESAQTTAPEAAAPAPEAAAPAPQSAAPKSPGKTKDVTKLTIEDIKVGTGAEAKSGNTVTVNYSGWLTDGSQFDSSYTSGQPFTFPLGQGQVIPGWDKGVEGMKVGGVRKLVIPPDMGYGAQGAGGVIPPNATLVFQVELLSVQ